MDWLNTALWNLCMSMLSQRNTNVLLVPVICAALLIPSVANAADEQQTTFFASITNQASLSRAKGDEKLSPGFFVSHSAITNTVRDPTAISILSLAKQTQKSYSDSVDPEPTISNSAGIRMPNGNQVYDYSDDLDMFHKHVRSHSEYKYAFDTTYGSEVDSKKSGHTTQYSNYHMNSEQSEEEGSAEFLDNPDPPNIAATEQASTGNGNGDSRQIHTKGMARDVAIVPNPTTSYFDGGGLNNDKALFDDANHVVPRKFTMPEPSIIAGAANKDIEVFLPGLQHIATPRNQGLISKRDLLESSGMSIADIMVIVTVDGRLYGVNRHNGDIVWRRDGLFDYSKLATDHGPSLQHPHEMVWTKNNPGFVSVPNANCSSHDNSDNGTECGEFNNTCCDGSSDVDDEEEWLLEQGIDWRSDPQVLEKQRQLRREWLSKRRRLCQTCNTSGNQNMTDTTGNFSGSESNTKGSDIPEIMYIAEPGGSGALYMYNSESGLQKLPLSIQDLVDQSPVQSHGTLYTGHKEANFASLDLLTGRLLSSYKDGHIYNSNGKDNGDEHIGTEQQHKAQIKVLFSEKLNHIRIYPIDDKSSRQNAIPQWELYHRFINAPTLDINQDLVLTELADAIEGLGYRSSGTDSGNKKGSGRDKDDILTHHTSHGPTKFVMTHDGGLVMIEAETGVPLWAQEFDAPVVNIFDIFGIADPNSLEEPPNYVARRRSLSPASQQARYVRYKQLFKADSDNINRHNSGFGSGRSSKWRTGSSGGNILAGAFWDRNRGHFAVPQIAYIGRLQNTLYTLTSDAFPLIDHQSLFSSLLLSLIHAKNDEQQYIEMHNPEWWARWDFLAQDASVRRILQEARTWWLKPQGSNEKALMQKHDDTFEKIMGVVAQKLDSVEPPQYYEYIVPDSDVCNLRNTCDNKGIVGIHHLNIYNNPATHINDALPPRNQIHLLPSNENHDGIHSEDYAGRDNVLGGYGDDANDVDDVDYADDNDRSQADNATGNYGTKAKITDDEKRSWWRLIGHYMTRVAAVIGYTVTIAFLIVLVSAVYLLRPRNKRRPRMWIDVDDENNTPGRRARLRISWALMRRMWDILREEWKFAVEEAWRNPNAAAVLRRTGVSRGTPPAKDTEDDTDQLEHSRQSSLNLSSLPQRPSSSHSSRHGSSSHHRLAGLGDGLREDSEPSSFDRLPSGPPTPRRNSIGALPMTPLNKPQLDGDSIERLQLQLQLQAQGQRIGQQSLPGLNTITLTDQVLGYGSHGTVVYRGEFQGRAVAVKRLLLDFYDVADHEVQVLQESDSHPNVIRYFCTERHDHFMYIALELCAGSLADAVIRSPKAILAQQLLERIPKQKVLQQLARGLHHLHALKLVHRDIKPQNILIAPPPHRRRRRAAVRSMSNAGAEDNVFEDTNIVAGSGIPRVLLSDFGLSRILDDDESSFANTYTMHGILPPGFGNDPANKGMPGGLPPGMIGGIGGGTVGWRAPECFDSLEARTSVSAIAGSANSAGAGSVAAYSTSTDPSWPSLHPRQGGNALEEPSPYISRGTKSRLRQLAMTRAIATADAAASSSSAQADGDEPDSATTSTTTTENTSSLGRAMAASTVSAVVGSRRRMTRAVDIFSLGCVFYYVLMDGEHPFGDRLSREQRILTGIPDLRSLESSSTPSAIEAVDLIAHMIARNERDRPSAASVLVHPYFWDATQRLSFMQDVSDCLEAEARLIKSASESVAEPPPKKSKGSKKKAGNSVQHERPTSHVVGASSIEDVIGQLPTNQGIAVRRAMALLDLFEENSEFVMAGAPPSQDGFQVVGQPQSNHSEALEAMEEAVAVSGNGNGKGHGSCDRPRRVFWDRRLDPHLRRDLGKFRKYDGNRLRDLLRIIRNKKNHYQDMPPQLRQTLGDIPDGYLHYFESRFPYLLLHCYYFVLENDELRTNTVFKPYFRPPSM